MPRAMKGAGKGAATKRKERRHAKFNPGPGPQSVKLVGGAEAAGFDDGNVEAKKKKKLGKLSKKRKAEGASTTTRRRTAAAAKKKFKSPRSTPRTRRCPRGTTASPRGPTRRDGSKRLG